MDTVQSFIVLFPFWFMTNSDKSPDTSWSMLASGLLGAYHTSGDAEEIFLERGATWGCNLAQIYNVDGISNDLELPISLSPVILEFGDLNEVNKARYCDKSSGLSPIYGTLDLRWTFRLNK